MVKREGREIRWRWQWRPPVEKVLYSVFVVWFCGGCLLFGIELVAPSRSKPFVVALYVWLAPLFLLFLFAVTVLCVAAARWLRDNPPLRREPR